MLPAEVTHEGYVDDFLAADWPSQTRSLLRGYESSLCASVSRHEVIRSLRPGTVDLLRWGREAGLPVGIASNALSGSVHRAFLADHGLSDLIDAEVDSDEAGVRKPNPSLIHRAADVLGLPTASCV